MPSFFCWFSSFIPAYGRRCGRILYTGSESHTKKLWRDNRRFAWCQPGRSGNGFMDDTVVIGLYRHGLTVDNERKAYSGWTDSILSEEGKKELKRIQPCLPAYEKVVTSDLQRCVHTAGLLFPEHSTEAWPEFREMNFGRWEGKMHKEAESIEEYRVWVNDPFSHPIPEGE